MPDQLAGRFVPAGVHDSAAEPSETSAGFLEELLGQLGEVPLFLRGSLGPLAGLPSPSLHDFFWAGGERYTPHPYLTTTLVVMVNRRKKKPRCDTATPPWQQPLYVMVQRDGTYLFGRCGVEDGSLVIHPYLPNAQFRKTFLYPRDVEMVGQIVTLTRRVL